MPSGYAENSLNALKPNQYKSGAEWKGNAKGGRRLGATVRDWWNSLAREDENGVPKYTLAEIEAFADAPSDDESISPAKKIAARHITELVKGGRVGREIMHLIFDRTEGRPQQSLQVSGSLAADPAAEVTADTLAKIRVAASGNGSEV